MKNNNKTFSPFTGNGTQIGSAQQTNNKIDGKNQDNILQLEENKSQYSEENKSNNSYSIGQSYIHYNNDEIFNSKEREKNIDDIYNDCYQYINSYYKALISENQEGIDIFKQLLDADKKNLKAKINEDGDKINELLNFKYLSCIEIIDKIDFYTSEELKKEIDKLTENQNLELHNNNDRKEYEQQSFISESASKNNDTIINNAQTPSIFEKITNPFKKLWNFLTKCCKSDEAVLGEQNHEINLNYGNDYEQSNQNIGNIDELQKMIDEEKKNNSNQNQSPRNQIDNNSFGQFYNENKASNQLI